METLKMKAHTQRYDNGMNCQQHINANTKSKNNKERLERNRQIQGIIQVYYCTPCRSSLIFIVIQSTTVKFFIRSKRFQVGVDNK